MALTLKPVSPARERAATAAAEREPKKPSSRPDPDSGSQKRPDKPPRPKPTSRPKLAEGNTERSPYAGERRVQVSVALYPSLWEGLEQRAEELVDRGEKASASALFVSILHFYMPRGDGEAEGLVRGFLLEQAGAARERALAGEGAVEINARLFESQRDQLSQLGRAVSKATGERYGRMLIANALIHRHAPSDSNGASLLLRAMDLLKLGEGPARSLLEGEPLAQAS